MITNPQIETYIEKLAGIDPEPMYRAWRNAHLKLMNGKMVSTPLQGRFLAQMVKAIGAKRILELGTFTGYTALWMASMLPDDGELHTVDFNDEVLFHARNHIENSPWKNQIHIHQGKALQVLETLSGPFDLIFIDADKSNYPAYFEKCFEMLSSNGTILIDNVLWYGTVLEENPTQRDAATLKKLNADLAADPRINFLILPIRDGISMITRKA